jgi:hypothetical protein
MNPIEIDTFFGQLAVEMVLDLGKCQVVSMFIG